ncbi:SdpA family antimicrobial peptide system protein [Bacillus inaquosorum]|uniref:SdpA family antimicrobial peptide system protein n=1 Tax=Bacillus inaquosorum TaxID=483913 RepID=UPI002282A111|nr:SdpA family antimicrobial peptide system protein [Bacillus inaquosorum]MCY8995122.1 SdpA family antimicrobial peptide system protein [Bacillus inaquosorum]MCY9009132.1 SdpA family antimicrobial peptide system protein [Bacillus inaquosorum]MCY9037338.1 SdpA family antimicrobial peptide system protein [Bacillus inaquosorum]MCY9046332.1 SdpA family antimicrobial peptide system protein [Bacillus inaquosorum]MCY9056516.1 SdpA family antimicrobial peptide system protein [Bacillus inaquosorum]
MNDFSSDKSRIGLFFLTICACLTILLFSSIIVALPKNPLSTTVRAEFLVKQFIPQGWGFYSRDPRSDHLYAYSMSGDTDMLSWPNNKIRNVFGLNRYGRAQGIELGLLISKLPSSLKWKTCDKDAKNCLDEMKVQAGIANPTPNASLCGDLGIVSGSLVPWAWSQYKVVPTSKVMRVNVKCSKR